MSYDLTNDADQPEGPNLPGISAINLRRVRNGSITAVVRRRGRGGLKRARGGRYTATE